MSLVSRLLSRLWLPVQSRIMSLVDDRKQIGSDPHPIAAWVRRDGRVARRLQEEMKKYPNTRAISTILATNAVEPLKSPYAFTDPALVVGRWDAAGVEHEHARQGNSVFVHSIEGRFVANSNAPVEGLYVRLMCLLLAPGFAWLPGSGWDVKRVFKPIPSGSSYVAIQEIARPVIDDDERICCLYDSGLMTLGGPADAVMKPLDVNFPVGKEFTYRTGIVWDSFVPTDVNPNLVWVIAACSRGTSAGSDDFGDATWSTSIQGTAYIHFSNVQS